MCEYCNTTREHYLRNGEDIGCDICVEWMPVKEVLENNETDTAYCPHCGAFMPEAYYYKDDEIVGCTNCIEEYELTHDDLRYMDLSEDDLDEWEECGVFLRDDDYYAERSREREREERSLCYGTPYAF